MAIETRALTVGGLSVDLVRKSIKNLHLAVYPPDGRVRVAAPWHLSEDAVRLAVATRVAWINRQRRRFLAQERQSKRAYVSGETHHFLGRRYRLIVDRGSRTYRVRLVGANRLELRVPENADRDACDRALGRWYRRELRDRAVAASRHWAARLGIEPPRVGIKRMRTKWGTCSISNGRIWVNLELAKKPPRCMEYIVLHELLHFQHRNHGEAFVKAMDGQMSNWRSVREELNRLPLASETWSFEPEL